MLRGLLAKLSWQSLLWHLAGCHARLILTMRSPMSPCCCSTLCCRFDEEVCVLHNAAAAGTATERFLTGSKAALAAASTSAAVTCLAFRTGGRVEQGAGARGLCAANAVWWLCYDVHIAACVGQLTCCRPAGSIWAVLPVHQRIGLGHLHAFGQDFCQGVSTAEYSDTHTRHFVPLSRPYVPCTRRHWPAAAGCWWLCWCGGAVEPGAALPAPRAAECTRCTAAVPALLCWGAPADELSGRQQHQAVGERGCEAWQ